MSTKFFPPMPTMPKKDYGRNVCCAQTPPVLHDFENAKDSQNIRSGGDGMTYFLHIETETSEETIVSFRKIGGVPFSVGDKIHIEETFATMPCSYLVTSVEHHVSLDHVYGLMKCTSVVVHLART